MRIMVAYDGSLQAKEALIDSIKKVEVCGGKVVALHVFDMSPFIDYDAGPRAVETAKQEAARSIAEAKKIIQKHGEGITTGVFSAEGNAAEVLFESAREFGIDTLLCPRGIRCVICACRKAGMQEINAVTSCRCAEYAFT